MNKNYLIGISFKLLNCLIFPTMSLLMLKSVSTIPVMQVFFAQVFLGAIISSIYLFAIRQPISLYLPRKDFLLYLSRAVINLVAIKLWIFSLTELGMNEATALGYTGPLYVFLMARYIIGEKFKAGILILIIINIVGMLIILQPKYIDMNWQGITASLGAILLWSVYEVICKKQTSNQHYMLQTFYFMSISSIVVAPFIFNSWQNLTLQEGSMLIIIAMLAVANITAIFIAYSFAPLMLLAPFSYARLIFTVFLTGWLHHVSPNIQIFIGAAVIMMANGYFTYRIQNKLPS